MTLRNFIYIGLKGILIKFVDASYNLLLEKNHA